MFVSSRIFSGFFDSTPAIDIDRHDALLFTDERPDMSDESILLCVPGAYSSTDNDIIGHYSVGGKRKGISDRRYTTFHLDRNTHFQQA